MGVNDSPLTRRTVIKSLGAGAGIAGLAGCSGGSGGDSGGSGDSGSSDGSSDSSGSDSGGGEKATVRVAGTGGSWGESRAEGFYDPFRNGELAWDDKHNLEFSGIAAEQYVSELQRDPENPAYDAIELDGQRAALLGENDAVSSQAEELDNFDNIPEAFRNEYMCGTVYFPRGIAYREDKTDKEFNTWDDLIDPELEGRVGFEPWNNAGSKYFYVINAAKGGDLDNLEPGLEWLREFVETTDPIIFDSIDQALQLWTNDEMDVAPFLSARAENLEIDEGLEIGFSVPEGGAPQDFWGYPLTKHNGEDRHEQARIFADGCLEPQPQAMFAEVMGYPPANPDAVEHISDEALENHPMIQPSEEQMERYNVDVDWVQAAKQSNEDGEKFRKIIAG
ncbi:ABC transporter substrate-binding protein [Halobellus salinisoli]|uniref:ABC transporter substrate-binding protein n=1 Tax=Halobellus salinisoli TaxID=3108500 RepID=UPI0030093EC5